LHFEHLSAVRGALASLERSWDADAKHSSVERTITIKEGGLFLGATRLAPSAQRHEQRIYALVSYVACAAAPKSLLKTVEAAEADYKGGDKAMANMRLALAIPTPSDDEVNWRKLHIAAGLIDSGLLSPEELLKFAKIDGGQSDKVDKYSPDQPRVPAGNSDGGQWTSGDSGQPTRGHDENLHPSKDEVAVLMPEGCDEEWKGAIAYCIKLLAMANPPRSLTGGHNTPEGCAKGFVSMWCGGNKV
jgi:hypothetical protein